MKTNPPIIIVVCLVASATLANAQGPLAPHAAPAPTMLTLSQVEPRTPISAVPATITASGSYYLTTNLTTGGAVSAITVLADDVTLDLNGFALQGSNNLASFGVQVGIYPAVTQYNVTIRNGTVRGWGTGVQAVNAVNSQFEKLRLYGNTGGDGLDTGTGCFVADCTTQANTVQGIYGGTGSTVRNCVANNNGTNGIAAGYGCRVLDCTADYNGVGIVAVGNCTVSGCTAYFNSRQGIRSSQYCSITGCTASENSLDGILVDAACNVFNNTADFNGGSVTFQGGIHATGNGNRIDSNHSFNNSADGILVDTNATANIVIRNMSASNGGFNYRVPGIPTQLPAGANIVGSVQNDATNSHVNAWSNFQF